MAVGAQNAGAVDVVEQHKVTDELVLVRRHALAEDAEARIAVAGWHIAQHLVVAAVFLDDIDDVLEHARFTDAFRHRLWRAAWTRR